MDDKKKIVLGSEDFLAKGIDDIFININLQQKFNIIKKHRFDNNFDLAEQFRKERNASRSFRIYGILDSMITDCDNLTIKVFAASNVVGGIQVLSNQIATITSQPLGFGDKNVFGKQKGKYILELNNYGISEEVYLEILGDGVTYARTVIKQQLVFRDADGEFVEYGTDTVDFGLNGGVEVIQNDFPFFYNKHWIKNNFQIEEVKIRNVSFNKSSYSINEGDNDVIIISLNNPSVFGTESITVNLTTPITEEYDTAAPVIDFAVPFAGFPLVFTWAVGETDKIIPVAALNDFVIEKNSEVFSLSLSDPQNVTIGQGVVSIQSTNVEIIDQTLKKFVNYIFQKIVRNITPVTNTLLRPELRNVPGIEMNVFDAKTGNLNQNYRFFPNDTFELEITNKGDATTLPIIPDITSSEQFFAAGQTIVLNVENKYQNHNSLPKEVAVFDFRREADIGSPFGSFADYYIDNFYINGIRFDSIPLVADKFVTAIQQKYLILGIDMPFNINQQGRNVFLTANHPANNINGFIPRKFSFPGFDYALQGFDEVPEYPNGRVETITDQIPFELKLYANTAGGESQYEFIIKKKGYKSIVVAEQPIVATTTGVDAYLISSIRDVYGPSLSPTDPLVCNLNTATFDADGYYLNGAALIADSIPAYAAAIAVNEHASGFVAEFEPAPLVNEIIICNNLIELSKSLS